jgi:hypothetical protein
MFWEYVRFKRHNTKACSCIMTCPNKKETEYMQKYIPNYPNVYAGEGIFGNFFYKTLPLSFLRITSVSVKKIQPPLVFSMKCSYNYLQQNEGAENLGGLQMVPPLTIASGSLVS